MKSQIDDLGAATTHECLVAGTADTAASKAPLYPSDFLIAGHGPRGVRINGR